LVPALNKKNANTLRERFLVRFYAILLVYQGDIADSSKHYRWISLDQQYRGTKHFDMARLREKLLARRAEQQHHKMSRVVAINS
jgi:hypothetical protein